MSLAGKVAVVTGGGSGIGRACCVQLAEDGAGIAVWDLNAEGADETVAMIEKAGGRAIACIGDAFFERFLNVVPHPELMKPEYRRQPARFAARERIDAIINEELSKNTSEHWLRVLREARIPCGPVNDIAGVFTDPQVRARGMVTSQEHPHAGPLPLVNNPIRLSATPVEHRRAPQQKATETKSPPASTKAEIAVKRNPV